MYTYWLVACDARKSNRADAYEDMQKKSLIGCCMYTFLYKNRNARRHIIQYQYDTPCYSIILTHYLVLDSSSNSCMGPGVYVVVQFYIWFNLYFPLFDTHYYTRTKKVKLERMIKLNHNIHDTVVKI